MTPHRTIPIVFVGVADPFETGIVARLNQPGGNTTGFATLEPSLAGKWLELLSESAPGLKRAAVVFNTAARSLAALAALQGRGDANLDAELVRLVGLALTDALDLGSVQAVDLGAALAALLIAYPPRQAQHPSKRGLPSGVAVDLAGNVAHDAAIAATMEGATKASGANSRTWRSPRPSRLAISATTVLRAKSL